jgi:hypothetical protein
MPLVVRRRSHLPMSSVVTHRTGGRVNLFNYNPSIAGGKLAIHRDKGAHYRGRFRGNDASSTMPATTSGGGLQTPGHSGGRGVENYQGLGATGRTAMHPAMAQKKRLYEVISNNLTKAAKKSKA